MTAAANRRPRTASSESADGAAGPPIGTTYPLVEAKLHPPTTRPGTVERTQLVRLLTAAAGPPIVSVVAPPGYGKTTLLAQWTSRERRPVVWLTIDDLDNTPAVLLSYLAVAFDRIEPVDHAIQAAIAAPRERLLATAVPRLASELARWPKPAAIVLDDIHRLTDRVGLDALAALMDHLPPGFRMVLSGRTEPESALRSTPGEGRPPGDRAGPPGAR